MIKPFKQCEHQTITRSYLFLQIVKDIQLRHSNQKVARNADEFDKVNATRFVA